jgi:hypothetical protein
MGLIKIIITVVAIGTAAFGVIAIVFDGNFDQAKEKLGFLKKANSNIPDKKQNKKPVKESKESQKTKSTDKKEKVYFHEAQDFLDFEKIEEMNPNNPVGLIVRKSETEFVGMIEVFGTNFNLLSMEERNILEDSFSRLLNGIDYPIQIYIQTRKLEIENYKQIYAIRFSEIEAAIKRLNDKIEYARQQDITEDNVINELITKKKKLEAQYSYGLKLNQYIEARCKDKHMLERKYFISVTYKHNPSKYKEELSYIELLSNAYFDINNKLNSIITSLSRAQLGGKIMSATEIAECLYVAYNKSGSQNLSLRNALKSNFSHYYSTAEQVEAKIIKNKIKDLEDKEKKLKEQIEDEKAIQNVKSKTIEV